MNIVILAAGMGKRMHSVLPKVLQPLAGRPMLEHVLEATSGFSSSPRVVVVGHRAEDVRARFGGRDDVAFALQEPQLGTGHALKVAFGHLDPSDPKTLVCLGDVPLLSRETIAAMQEEASGQDLVLLTVELPDPTGYGRIVRDEFGRVTAIVEVGDGIITKDITDKALTMLDVDHEGLDYIDQKILRTMIEVYNGGPVGLGTLSVNIAEERDTVEDMYEPYLIQKGFIMRTRTGRVATAKAYDHLGYPYAEK